MDDVDSFSELRIPLMRCDTVSLVMTAAKGDANE
jgi:hypothetical protein